MMLSATSLVKAVVIVTLIAIALRVRARLEYRRQSRLHGCEAPPCLPQVDPVFGLDLILARFISFKADRRNVSLL